MLGLGDGPVKILNVFTFYMLNMPTVTEVAGSNFFSESQIGIPSMVILLSR